MSMLFDCYVEVRIVINYYSHRHYFLDCMIQLHRRRGSIRYDEPIFFDTTYV